MTMNTYYFQRQFCDQSDQFRKGSYLYTDPEIRDDPVKDRFHGFRQRLKIKFDRLHGYLESTHNDSLEELERLDLVDPLYKIKHNIRPSEARKHAHETEQNFVSKKKKVEDRLADCIEKLVIWNTYFGKKEEEGGD